MKVCISTVRPEVSKGIARKHKGFDLPCPESVEGSARTDLDLCISYLSLDTYWQALASNHVRENSSMVSVPDQDSRSM